MTKSEDQEALLRRAMVEQQLQRRGITDRYTLNSMMAVPRHRFVPSSLQMQAYDAIVVTAGAPVLPQTMVGQLKIGGKLVIPVGDSSFQKLMHYTKQQDDTLSGEVLQYVRFVPLIGEEGWY